MLIFLNSLICFLHVIGFILAIANKDWSEMLWIISSFVWFLLFLKEEK